MEIRTYKVYKFDELTPELKAKVLDNYRHFNVRDNDWYEGEIDYWITEKLEPLGYQDIDIQFSGFASQGDGASFTAKVDLPEYLKAHKLKTKYPLIAKALEAGENILFYSKRNSHHYAHEYTCKIECDYYGDEGTEKEVNELEKFMEEERQKLCKEIYKSLGLVYDDYTSDECISENLIANDYSFNEAGKIDKGA